MVARRSLVLLSDGRISELPSGDTLLGASASTQITTLEIDFGTTPVSQKVFTVTDALVSFDSRIIAIQSGEASTGRSADENEIDAILFNATPGEGTFKLNATCVTGKVSGKFKVNYQIG